MEKEDKKWVEIRTCFYYKLDYNINKVLIPAKNSLIPWLISPWDTLKVRYKNTFVIQQQNAPRSPSGISLPLPSSHYWATWSGMIPEKMSS